MEDTGQVESIIDFEKLAGIVPERGSLVLKFTRVDGGRLQMVYAPKYEGKEDRKEMAPLVLTGTPREIGEGFGQVVSEVFPYERMLGTAEDKVKKRKEGLESAVAKSGDKKPPAKPESSEGNLFAKKKKEG